MIRGTAQDISCDSQKLHFERKARQFMLTANRQAQKGWESVSYHQAVSNATFISTVEGNKKSYEEAIAEGQKRYEEEMREKERVLREWATTRDSLAAKKDQIAALLTELTETRQKCKEAAEKASKGEPALSSEMNIDESLRLLDSPGDSRPYRMTVIDENAVESNSLQLSMQDREREGALKQHFNTQKAQLLSRLEEVDEKALKYHQEYAKLCEALAQARAEIQVQEEQIASSQVVQAKASSDLESTRRNYEDQMRLMTEHFMSLNDKVGKQEDSLERLRSHKVHCARCGTWNTVAWLTGPEGLNGRRCSHGNHHSSYNYS